MTLNNFLLPKNLSQSLITLLSLVTLDRGVLLIFFHFVRQSPRALAYITDDGWHHYHIGMIVALASLLLWKFKYRNFVFLFGLSVILEEWAVLAYESGFPTQYLYLTITDYGVTILVLMSLLLGTKIYSRFKNTR